MLQFNSFAKLRGFCNSDVVGGLVCDAYERVCWNKLEHTEQLTKGFALVALPYLVVLHNSFKWPSFEDFFFNYFL